jgi:hypothetical protein
LKKKKPDGESGSLPRRTFIKKAIIGIALLPYVAPLIESFTLVDEDAGMAYATTKKSSGKGGKGGGGRTRGRSRISPTQKTRNQMLKSKTGKK